jgi:XTP/dITP diphosphohydrolase
VIHCLVIATHNRKKAGEMVQILSHRFPDLEIKTLADYPGSPEPEETGETYQENAAIKAKSAAEFTGEWSLADDAGLEIDALGGAPGVKSKRFEGENSSFDHKIARILEMLQGVPENDRTARFQCFIAICPPRAKGEIFSFNAICEGRIAECRSGAGGFGYDPIFFLPELGCTMADLTVEEKHQVSHRGKVLHQFGDWLATFQQTSR